LQGLGIGHRQTGDVPDPRPDLLGVEAKPVSITASAKRKHYRGLTGDEIQVRMGPFECGQRTAIV